MIFIFSIYKHFRKFHFWITLAMHHKVFSAQHNEVVKLNVLKVLKIRIQNNRNLLQQESMP